MTFTNKTPESALRVPSGWDVIEGGEDVSFKSETKSKPLSLLEEEDTSFFSAEAVHDAIAQATSHPEEVSQE
jgi:hypothetical protein